MVKVLFHRDFRLHDPSPYTHPENPMRLDLAMGAVTSLRSPDIDILEPRLGDPGVFESVHEASYLSYVLSAGRTRVLWIDGDTYISPGTRRSVERLAGASLDALEMASEEPVVVLGRPPGHHAGRRGRAMGAPTNGFCLVNPVALIARVASGRGRVAVLDIDLHHGNGTQEIFYGDSGVLHVDIHQDPLTIYPGTGFPEDVGEGEGRGYSVNIVTPYAAGDDVYLDALDLALGFLEDYKPWLVVLSAGFDAFRGDNDFTIMNVGEAFYYRVGRALSEFAPNCIVVLEGGYGEGLVRGLRSLLEGLLGVKREYRVGRSSGSVWKRYLEFRARLEVSHGKGLSPAKLSSS